MPLAKVLNSLQNFENYLLQNIYSRNITNHNVNFLMSEECHRCTITIWSYNLITHSTYSILWVLTGECTLPKKNMLSVGGKIVTMFFVVEAIWCLGINVSLSPFCIKHTVNNSVTTYSEQHLIPHYTHWGFKIVQNSYKNV